MNPQMIQMMIEKIYNKYENNMKLSDKELYIVYGLFEGSYYKDERLEKILASREYKRKDLSRLLSVDERQISLYDEIPGSAVIYHYGDLEITGETIDDFNFPCFVYGSLIVDEVAKIDRYSDGPNGEKIPDKVFLPFYVQKDFVMGSLEEAHRVVLPEKIGRNADLRTLKTIDLPINCEVYGDINLSSMNNSNIVEAFNCHGNITCNQLNDTKQSVKKI